MLEFHLSTYMVRIVDVFYVGSGWGEGMYVRYEENGIEISCPEYVFTAKYPHLKEELNARIDAKYNW